MSLVLVVGLMPGLSAWGTATADDWSAQMGDAEVLNNGALGAQEGVEPTQDAAALDDGDGGAVEKDAGVDAADNVQYSAADGVDIVQVDASASNAVAAVDSAQVQDGAAQGENDNETASDGSVMAAQATGLATSLEGAMAPEMLTAASSLRISVTWDGDSLTVTDHNLTGVRFAAGDSISVRVTNTTNNNLTFRVRGGYSSDFVNIGSNSTSCTAKKTTIISLNITKANQSKMIDGFFEGFSTYTATGTKILYIEYGSTAPQGTILFNGNGGSNATPSYEGALGSTVYLSTAHPTTPTRTDSEGNAYTFSGWNTKADGSGDHYAATGWIKLTSTSVTLYAEWTRTANLITGPVGTASPGSSVTYHYDADGTAYYGGATGQAVAASITPDTSAGWTALGWTKDPAKTTADYETDFTIAGDSSAAADVTLDSAETTFYAVGERDLKVTYDGNSADAGTAPASQGDDKQTYNASGSVPLSTDTFTVSGKGGLAMDGRVFAGWNTEADGSGTMYQEGDSITVNEPLVLYAQWAYPVVYDANGGKAGTAPAAQQKLPGTDLVLHAGKPSRDPDTEDITTTLKHGDGATADSEKKTRRSEAWEFKEWDTQAGGTGTSYAPGDTYAADAAATLYAQWEVQNPTYGSTALPTPAWEGHDFLGWTPQENPSDEELAAALPGGSTYTPTADGTLYAQWKLKTYEVAYDANGDGVSGMPDPATAEKAHGADLTLSDATPARASAGKDIALTLDYKGGAYKAGEDAGAWQSGVSKIATATTAYTFQGWSTSPSASTGAYQPSGAYANNASTTLYAIWQPSTTGYATYKLPDASRTSATSVTYAFEGWSTSPTAKKGDSGIMAAGTDYQPTKSTTLYAVWDPPTYAIEYDANAGGADTVTGDLAMQTKEADVDVTLRAAPTRTRPADSFAVAYDAAGGTVATTAANTTASNTTQYAFKGWADAANIGSASDGVVTDDEWDAYAAGKKFAESDLNYTANADLKLYAQWTKTGSVSPVTLPTPERDGYEFDGWYTAAAGGTRAGGAGDAYTPSGDATLFARWTPRTYTVTYDANAGSGATVTNMPSPLSETKTHDADLALSASEPARADESGDVAITYDAHGGSTPAAGSSRYESRYGFLSWKKDGNTYAPGAAYREEGNATLKAEWAEATTYAPVTLPGTEWEGHIFLGWFTAETGGDEAGDAGDEYTPASKAAVTLHAHWETVKYDVTYDGNTEDATLAGVPDAQEKEHGADLALSATKPTRDDTVTEEFTVTFDRRGGSGTPVSDTSSATVRHVFRGWTTVDTVGAAKGEATDAEWSAYAGAKYEAGGTYADNAGATLYAQWQDVPQGAALDLPAAPTPPDSGYTFKGWSLSRDTAPDDETGALLAPGSKVYPYEDTVYYAIYDPPVYVVSYDANGGSGEPASQYKRHGEDLGLSGDEPARAGATEQYRVYYDAAGGSATAERSEELTATASYEFLGWAEDASVGAEAGIADDAEWAAYPAASKHAGGESYGTDADLDLFAQWKKTVASDPATVTLPAADRPGWTFLGWYDAGGERAGGAGDSYAPKGADETLAARWQQYPYPSDGEAFAYTVVFEQEDGTRIAMQQFTFGQSQALNAGTLVPPSGKVFAGWRLKGGASTFTEHQLVANLTDVADGEVTLVAQWKDAPADGSGGGGTDPADPDNPNGYNYYTVEYWEQGTDGVMYRRESTDRIFADTGDAAEVPATALDAPLGFHVDSGNADLRVADTVAADGATVLAVYWARNQFDVEFDAGAADATGTMEKQHFVWANGEKLTANAFVRAGYTFAGWKVTERDGAQLAAQSEGGLTVQSILDAVAGLFLGAQAAVDAPVADASDGSRLTPTDIADGGHVTLTAQWERGSSGGGSDDPAGPTDPTDPTDPDDPGDPKDPRDELADKIREAEDLVDPDLHPGRPANPDEEKRLRDEIDEAKRVLDDPDATPGRLREATDRLSGAIAAFAAATGGGPGGPGGGSATSASTTTSTTTTATAASTRKGSPSTGDSALLACAAVAAGAVTLAAALLAGRRRRRGGR